MDLPPNLEIMNNSSDVSLDDHPEMEEKDTMSNELPEGEIDFFGKKEKALKNQEFFLSDRQGETLLEEDYVVEWHWG
jgi:hypothetical protein